MRDIGKEGSLKGVGVGELCTLRSQLERHKGHLGPPRNTRKQNTALNRRGRSPGVGRCREWRLGPNTVVPCAPQSGPSRPGKGWIRAGPLSTQGCAPRLPGLPIRLAESEREVGILMRGLGLQGSFRRGRDSHDGVATILALCAFRKGEERVATP